MMPFLFVMGDPLAGFSGGGEGEGRGEGRAKIDGSDEGMVVGRVHSDG